MNNCKTRVVIFVIIVVCVAQVGTVAHKIVRTIKSLTETKTLICVYFLCNQQTHIERFLKR